MNKEEFFAQIMDGISFFEENEKMEIKNYYEELILDGMEVGASQEEVIAKLDHPKAIVERLKAEYAKPDRIKQKQEKTNISGEYAPNGKVSVVKIQAEDRSVRILPSSDDQLRIRYEAQDDDEIIYHEIDGVFYFRQRERRKFSFLKFNFSRGDSSIYLDVPKKMIRQIEISTKNGGIKCMDFVDDCSIFLETSNGGIAVENVIAKKIEVRTTNAGVSIRSVKSNQCTAKSTNSVVKVCDGAFAEKLSMQSTNGALKIDRVIAPDIEMKTTNGSIKGTILGKNSDYEIHSQTSNGSNNMPNGWGSGKERKLSVSTSNGSIAIEFVE